MIGDTDPKVAAMVRARHAAMTPTERMEIASSMFDEAVAIVESSLPAGDRRSRRLALARRLYGRELPEAALQAFADYVPPD